MSFTEKMAWKNEKQLVLATDYLKAAEKFIEQRELSNAMEMIQGSYEALARLTETTKAVR